MTTWFNDTFTEASTTLATSHTSDSGGTWVFWAGATPAPSVYTILSGSLGSGAAGTQVYRTSVIAPAADCVISAEANVQANTTHVSNGVCARLDAAGNNGYLAAYIRSSSQWSIFRIGTGLATTTLGTQTGTISYAINDTPNVSLSVTGSGATVTLELTVDGSVLVSTTDTSGSRVTAAGYGGIWFNTGVAASQWFWGSFAGDDAAPATAYTITSPLAGQVCQLSGGSTGNATVSLAGTYTGTAPDQWRVVQDGTSTAVTGLDWTSFTSAPAAGAFSQSITVPKESGWLNVQVRDSAGGTTQTSGKVGTGVLVALDGQSYAWLFFSTTAYAGDSSLTPDALLRITGKQPGAGNWNVPATATMNGAISMGNALVTACGCPVALVDSSWDGAGLTVSASGGQWISGGVAGNALTSSQSAISSAGNSVAATVWIQGQADAGSSVTQANYYTAFGQMAAIRRGVQGSTHPYVIVTHPRNAATLTDANVEKIRKAHVQACADADNYRVDSEDLPLHTDNVHTTATGFTTLGKRCAQAVLAALGLVTYYRGPQIASVDQISTTVLDVNLTHNAVGTDFTPTTAITGFRALVSGTPATISTAVQQSATKVRLTLSAPAASAPVVDYLYGATPTITGVVLDNSTLTLPLEYNSGITAGAADTTAPILTSPTGTATGITTATGTVTTDEANGTLYRLASINATETAATIKAASLTQSVALTGAQGVTFTGLTGGTTYHAHYVHRDAAGNDSAAVHSASFTTMAIPSITTEAYTDYSGVAVAPATVIPVVEIIDPSLTAGSRNILSLTNQVLDASSRLVVSSMSLTTGTGYLVVSCTADGVTRGAKKVTAA